VTGPHGGGFRWLSAALSSSRLTDVGSAQSALLGPRRPASCHVTTQAATVRPAIPPAMPGSGQRCHASPQSSSTAGDASRQPHAAPTHGTTAAHSAAPSRAEHRKPAADAARVRRLGRSAASAGAADARHRKQARADDASALRGRSGEQQGRADPDGRRTTSARAAMQRPGYGAGPFAHALASKSPAPIRIPRAGAASVTHVVPSSVHETSVTGVSHGRPQRPVAATATVASACAAAARQQYFVGPLSGSMPLQEARTIEQGMRAS